MNDLFTPDPVKDRLRRTLQFRAEDMAPGDLASGSSLTSLPALSGSGGRSGRPTARGRTLVVVAAALLLLAGAAASIVIALGGDGSGRVTNSPAATSAGPADTETQPVPPVDTSYPIGEYEGGGYRIHAQFDAGATTDPASESDLAEPVQAGPHQGFYVALPNGEVSELHLVVDGGMVVLRGGPLPRDQLIAAGASLTLDPATGLYTMPAPPGWTTLWTTPPDWGSPDPEAADDAGGVTIARLVDSAAPDARNVNVIWYRGWDEANLPEGVSQVEVNGQTAFVGTIAPGFAEGLQLWLAFDDGMVELQGVGLSSDELVTIAAGIHRAPGTDEEFPLTPPPGFERTGP